MDGITASTPPASIAAFIRDNVASITENLTALTFESIEQPGAEPHVAGDGGGETRTVSSSWFTAFATDTGNSFLSMEIDGCTLSAEAINAGGTTIDSFTIDGCD